MRIAFFLAYLATIPVANWMIGNIGTTCVPNGPCLVPVGFGLMAPSGVVMIGAALVLRDLVQEKIGFGWAFTAIICGVVVSAMLSPPALVLASAAAFAISELADLAVYTPLRRKNLSFAVLASGMVGAIIDSMAFLWLAFGSFDYMAGQVVGKLCLSVLAALILYVRSSHVWRAA